MIAHMDEDIYEQEGTLLSRSELVNNLFGDVGKLIDCDFSCSIESKILIHGKLYVSDRAICFYAKLKGIDRKIKIPFDCIKRLDKATTALVIPNSILVETDLHAYYFRSFVDRNNCFDILSSQLKSYHSLSSKYASEMKMYPEYHHNFATGTVTVKGYKSNPASSSRSSSGDKTANDWDYEEEEERRLAAEAKASYR